MGSELRIGVSGAGGRMGRAVIAAVADAADLRLGCACVRPGSAAVGRDAGEQAGAAAQGVAVADQLDPGAFDVLVEFATASAAAEHAELCAKAGRGLVIGVTGLEPGQRARVEAAAASIPVVWAPNMSVGVNLSFKLIEMAARVLGEEADVEIIEAHHRHKVDAPSGTALRMGEIAARALGRDLEQCAVYGRRGAEGPRARRTIGFATVRGGDIVGEHTVLFAGAGERLEITHRSGSRANFAAGALRAARWVHGRAPGLYDMADVLGLELNRPAG